MSKSLLQSFEELIKPHPHLVEDFNSSAWKSALATCEVPSQRGLISQYINHRLQMSNLDTMAARTHLYKDGPDKEYLGAIRKKMLRPLSDVVRNNEKTN